MAYGESFIRRMPDQEAALQASAAISAARRSCAARRAASAASSATPTSPALVRLHTSNVAEVFDVFWGRHQVCSV